MAEETRRRRQNVDGPFFVDDSCIDCGTCMWMAPETFREAGGKSAVHAQPGDPRTVHRAAKALLACPTASIGGGEPAQIRRARYSFPDPVAPGIWHLGFHAESSFGAAPYLAATPAGNVMIDCPRWSSPLATALDEMGGVQAILLTHRDDVADHARYAERFGAPRYIHEGDADAVDGAEGVFEGREPRELLPDVRAIPVPGHTRGSACYLIGEALFTGDHLAWDPAKQRLIAFRRACWHSWEAQRRSMRRLQLESFTRVLPGHGHPVAMPEKRMQDALQRCVEWMDKR